MGTDLAVVIPSRGRPESVERMALAFAETGADEVAVVWAIESNDRTIDRYEAAVAEWFGYGEVLRVEAGSMAVAVNMASVAVVDDLDPYAIAVLNDDHIPRTAGWHDKLVEGLRQIDPVGLVYPDDGLRGEKLATVWAVHGTWVRALRRMIPARVNHQYSDNAVMDLARDIDRMLYLPDVEIEHMHPAAGKAEMDKGYARVNNADAARYDRMMYRNWRLSDRRKRQGAALAALIEAWPRREGLGHGE